MKYVRRSKSAAVKDIDDIIVEPIFWPQISLTHRYWQCDIDPSLVAEIVIYSMYLPCCQQATWLPVEKEKL